MSSSVIVAAAASLVVALATPASATEGETNWQYVPNQGHSSDTPAAVTYNGQRALFIRDGDGLRWTFGGGPSRQIGGSARTVGHPTAMVYNGYLTVVYAHTDGTIRFQQLLNSLTNTWTDSLRPADVDPARAIRTRLSPAVTQYVNFRGDHLFVIVYTGLDGQIYHLYYSDDEGQWSPPAEIPGDALTNSSPAVAPTTTGDMLWVAHRGTDNIVYRQYYDRDRDIWAGRWESTGGVTPSGPAIAVNGNDVYLGVRGTTNQLFYAEFNGPTGQYYRPWTVSQDVLNLLGPPCLYALAFIARALITNTGAVYEKNLPAI